MVHMDHQAACHAVRKPACFRPLFTGYTHPGKREALTLKGQLCAAVQCAGLSIKPPLTGMAPGMVIVSYQVCSPEIGCCK